jgi:SAM-dependent methyltransferase
MQLPHIDNGSAFDWGKASADYALYRDIYPKEFYRKILELGLCTSGQRVLDLGTGTGILPRNLHAHGARFTGADISENQIAQAKALTAKAGITDIEYIVAAAEEVDFPDNTFDVVTACQCSGYFNANVLLPRLHRMLKGSGRLCILSLVWLPKESAIASASEALVLRYNPAWTGAGFTRPAYDAAGFPAGIRLGTTGCFQLDTAFNFDVDIHFTRESWHGRMKACRGIGASSLPEAEIAAFDAEHIRFLETQPEEFAIIHSANFCVLKGNSEL